MTTPPRPACRDTLQNISRYLDGELEPAACDAIERHALGCPGCATLLDGLRTTTGLCRQAGRADLPADVRRRARAAVQRLLDADAS